MKKVKNTESKNKNQLKVVAEASKPNLKPKNKVKKVKLPNEETKPKPVNENGATETQPEKTNNVAKIAKKKAKAENENGATATQPEKANNEGTNVVKVEKKKAKKLAQKQKKKVNKASVGNGPKPEEGKKATVAPVATKKPDLIEKLAQQQKKKANKASVGNGPKPEEGKKATVAPVATKKPDLIEKKKLRAAKKLKQKEERKRTERDPNESAATVFVGNVPVNTKRVQLVQHFKDYAPVGMIRYRTAGGKVIYKHKQRLAAGSLNAYVMLKDEATATRALALNGSEFKGNHLRVTTSDRNSHNRGEGDAKRTIFVGNLKYTANEEKIREIFSSCGDIEYVRCLRDGDNGCKGVSYVCFKSPEAVGLALELNETVLDERPIHVERYSVKKLGAKQARDARGEGDKKKSVKTGAQKRINDKNKKQGGKPSPKSNDDAPKKKGEFRGVKAGGVQKKKPVNKKKPTSQMQQLAKKIAPKAV